MGQTQAVQREVQINRPPEQVRQVLIDFPRWPEWNTGMMVSLLGAAKSPDQLQPGDKVKSDLNGTIMHLAIAENTSDCLSWKAGFHGLIYAHHQFYFRPGTNHQTPAVTTTLVEIEEFTGVLSFLFSPGWSQRVQLEGRIEKFHRELKARVESS